MAYDLGPLERDDRLRLVGDEEAEPPPPPRRWSPMILTLVVMAVFAGGLWFAYHEGQRHAPAAAGGNVPLIRADRSPIKVRPEAPGGMAIPDQNKLIYNETPGGPAMEKLLPPPEQPMARPAPEAPVAQAPAATPVLSPPEPQVPAPSNPPQPAVPAPPVATESHAAARPAHNAVRRRAPEPAGAGRIRVQLGAMRSPELARREWQRVKRLNSDVLGDTGAVAVRVDLGAKGIFYRIEAGPFASREAAERICGALKRRRFGCVLAR